MTTAFLILTAVGVLALGYAVMGRIDRFVTENRGQHHREERKR